MARRVGPVVAVLLLAAGAWAVRLWWPQWSTASLAAAAAAVVAAVVGRLVVRAWKYRGW